VVDRKSYIVYFKTPRVLKRIKKMADVSYFNKKRRYAVIYVDEQNHKKVVNNINTLKHVKKVEESQFDMEQFQFDTNVK
jgi:uncharacterized protein YlbG (UPF0298 family)